LLTLIFRVARLGRAPVRVRVSGLRPFMTGCPSQGLEHER
jgi:hypothetical protein